MSIRNLIEAINPSKKVLTWMVITAIASIPTVWVLSGKISTKKVMNDIRLNTLEVSVRGIYDRLDEIENNYNVQFETAVTELGNVIKQSEKNQLNQLKFVVDNWSKGNTHLINSSLDLNQKKNEDELDKKIGMINNINKSTH